MNIRVRWLDRDGAEHEEIRRGLTAGTFQHEVDHLDGVLFLDRADPRTLTTWEQFDRFGREEFEERARALVERVGLVTDATGASSRGSAATGRARRRGRVDGERITSVDAGVAEPPARRRRLPGLTLPGLANAHSHAFHRALRGRTQAGAGASGPGASEMYALAARLDPDSVLPPRPRDLRRDGARRDHRGRRVPLPPPRARRHPYDDPNEMGRAMIAAAPRPASGSPCSTPATCTAASARRLDGVQRRFSDGDADALGARASTMLAADPEAVRRRCDPQRPRGRSRRAARRSPTGPGTRASRCTPTSPSSRPRTRPASRPTGAPRPRCSTRPARWPSVHRGACHPPHRRRRRGCSAAAAVAAASVRRPSAISPTASARRARSRTPAPRWRSAAIRTR